MVIVIMIIITVTVINVIAVVVVVVAFLVMVVTVIIAVDPVSETYVAGGCPLYPCPTSGKSTWIERTNAHSGVSSITTRASHTASGTMS